MNTAFLSTQRSLKFEIKFLGDLLGKVLAAAEGEEFLRKIEEIRQQSKNSRQMAERANETLFGTSKLKPFEINKVTKAFALFLQLSNLAEQRQRVRRRADYTRDESLHNKSVSIRSTLNKLLETHHVPKEVYSYLKNQSIDLVLTAHPTEVVTQRIWDKYQKIFGHLEVLESATTGYDQHRLDKFLQTGEGNILATKIFEQIMLLWLTPEIRSSKPSPEEEAALARITVESVLWQALPSFLKVLKFELEYVLACSADEINPFRISSWMGGDRDGHPGVTAEVTERVLLQNEICALGLLAKDIQELEKEFAFAKEFACQTDTGKTAKPLAEPKPQEQSQDQRHGLSYDLTDLVNKILQRKNLLESTLHSVSVNDICPNVWSNIWQSDLDEEIYRTLQTASHALRDNNAQIIADGTLKDTLIRLNAFGTNLLKLDLRDDSQSLVEFMDEVTNFLSDTKFSSLTAAERRCYLKSHIAQQRPVLKRDFYLHSCTQKVARLFTLISEVPAKRFNCFIVSMTRDVSDLLILELLKKEFGVTNLPVVPLFETMEDLHNAPRTMEDWLKDCQELNIAVHTQQVMIGYSDSAKSGGLFASAWQLHNAQKLIQAVCEKQNTAVLFFHGRGGAIGRGGGPIRSALGALPQAAFNGKFRITEQGEMIRVKLGFEEIAKRTFELYCLSTLEKQCKAQEPQEDSGFFDICQTIAAKSQEIYRKYVYETPEFLTYFYATTPVTELKNLRIGSRPQSRSNKADITSLRAIPWNFAWTQNRGLACSWVGLGQALKFAKQQYSLQQLQLAYKFNSFFKVTIDLLEMVLEKTDWSVVSLYENSFMPAECLPIAKQLREEFYAAKESLLEITQQSELLSKHPVLQSAIKVRTPYIDPLHHLQIETLRRMRGGDTSEDTMMAFLMTVNGIAAGMRNTG